VPRVDGWRLIRDELVFDAVRRDFTLRLRAEAATVGLALLMGVAQDPARSVAARVSPARALLGLAEHAGKDGATHG
jgi:hypothetical protein